MSNLTLHIFFHRTPEQRLLPHLQNFSSLMHNICHIMGNHQDCNLFFLIHAEVVGALEAVYAPEDGGDDPELEAAAALVDSRYRKKLAIGRRDLVVAALQRRGFAYPVIKEAIRRVEEE